MERQRRLKSLVKSLGVNEQRHFSTWFTVLAIVIFYTLKIQGSAIIAKSALNHGMSHFTFAVYRNVFATIVFAPFALLFERKIRPKMSISILLKIMLLGLGALFIAAGCICWACFYNLQAITLKTYPATLSLTCLICWAGALQGTVLTLVVEKGNTSIWAIQWDTTFLSYVYTGMVTSGVGYYVSGLIMKEKGPVFVTAFNPLNMVIVAILGSFILSEELNLGRVLGGAIIVIGLYLVIWGIWIEERSKDTNRKKGTNKLKK
ncbi:WAT1-related protein At2g39510-like [Solanum tuberosum]|uniref:WAT1-related protein At2g39510-like n=1 Tax=Solanum tuberosum TaxID=4113 RepID=UPI00073A4E8D|nr:PREDICTED: WAT1-related protein At2g39510-like [Solanum tuberosum]